MDIYIIVGILVEASKAKSFTPAPHYSTTTTTKNKKKEKNIPISMGKKETF